MSWLEKLLPPRIQHTDPAGRRTIPEGLWIKCPSCETVLYKTDLGRTKMCVRPAAITTVFPRAPG